MTVPVFILIKTQSFRSILQISNGCSFFESVAGCYRGATSSGTAAIIRRRLPDLKKTCKSPQNQHRATGAGSYAAKNKSRKDPQNPRLGHSRWASLLLNLQLKLNVLLKFSKCQLSFSFRMSHAHELWPLLEMPLQMPLRVTPRFRRAPKEIYKMAYLFFQCRWQAFVAVVRWCAMGWNGGDV